MVVSLELQAREVLVWNLNPTATDPNRINPHHFAENLRLPDHPRHDLCKQVRTAPQPVSEAQESCN